MVGLTHKSSQQTLKQLEKLRGDAQWQQQSWAQLQEIGLPKERDEGWKYTSLNEFALLSFQAADKQPLTPETLAWLSQFEGYRLVFSNGAWLSEWSDVIPGVTITPIEQWNEQQLKQVNQSVQGEAFALLTDATANAGIHLEVSREFVADKPIYLLHVQTANRGVLCSYRHHLELSRLTQCQLYEHYFSFDESHGVTCSRVSANVAEGAQLEHAKVIEEGSQQHHFAHNNLRLTRDSQAQSHSFLLRGQLIRQQTSTLLAGTGAEVQMHSLSLPEANTTSDSRTFLRHQAAHCRSYQSHKVIAKEESNAVFHGLILVDKGALKTDGQMDNHNLLLGNHSQVNSQPQLEIYADDVKCSHGATTGQIDPEQLFYLQARGIEHAKALHMLTYAFAGERIAAVSDSKLRDYLAQRVSSKLEA
ncbi:Fe-S cluster assembly protein SufD [Vibrio mimicus]